MGVQVGGASRRSHPSAMRSMRSTSRAHAGATHGPSLHGHAGAVRSSIRADPHAAGSTTHAHAGFAGRAASRRRSVSAHAASVPEPRSEVSAGSASEALEAAMQLPARQEAEEQVPPAAVPQRDYQPRDAETFRSPSPPPSPRASSGSQLDFHAASRAVDEHKALRDALAPPLAAAAASMWLSRCISAAATIGLPDAIAATPSGAPTVAELAEATNTHAPTLYRLMRALAGQGPVPGLFVEVREMPDATALRQHADALVAGLPGPLASIGRVGLNAAAQALAPGEGSLLPAALTPFVPVFGMVGTPDRPSTRRHSEAAPSTAGIATVDTSASGGVQQGGEQLACPENGGSGAVAADSPDLQRRYALTPLGALLREGVPGGMRDWAIMCGGEIGGAWGGLEHSVRSGETAFDHVFGTDFWSYWESNPERGAIWDRTMTNLSEVHVAEGGVADSFDFSYGGAATTVCDVGGGQGRLLAHILGRFPGMRGYLFDLPQVLDASHSQEYLGKHALSGRAELAKGSFFDAAAIPRACDIYVMKHIIHDWNDAQAVVILENIASAARSGSRVLLCEIVISEDNDYDLSSPEFGPFFDLNMLVTVGGAERRGSDFVRIFAAAGLEFEGITRGVGPAAQMCLVQARKP